VSSDTANFRARPPVGRSFRKIVERLARRIGSLSSAPIPMAPRRSTRIRC